jgi:hypothetical protein
VKPQKIALIELSRDACGLLDDTTTLPETKGKACTEALKINPRVPAKFMTAYPRDSPFQLCPESGPEKSNED